MVAFKFSGKSFGQRPGFFPGVLSFCLPGLGQLYQRRFLPAFCGFVPFWATLALRPGTLWPVGLAIVFGSEAFYRGQEADDVRASESASRRRKAYGTTAVVAF